MTANDPPQQASLQVPQPEASPTTSSVETPLIQTPRTESPVDGSSNGNSNGSPTQRRPSPLNLHVRGSSAQRQPRTPSRQGERKKASPAGAEDYRAANSKDEDDDGDGYGYWSAAEEDSGEEYDAGEGKTPLAMAGRLERPPMHRPTDGRSEVPLLKEEPQRGRPSYDSPAGSARPAFHARRSTFRSRSPDLDAKDATRKKYMYASFFLVVSLVSFVIQTETASYIPKHLGWKKPYCMLWLTHGSWSLLWPAMLLILRIRKWRLPWATFWRRHKYILRTTGQMVQSQDLHLERRDSQQSPVPYILRTTAVVTSALTIAGGSWYVAVNLTTPSDLTAIYNCSAFFAYAFSIPLLGDRLRFDKVFSVAVAIAGVLTVAYGDSGGGDEDADGGEVKEGMNRALGNVVIGIGSVLYGLYEVLYKKKACPPEGTSAGRGMLFAMTFGSLIGMFTLCVLWIPLPILHLLGWETFELPTGKAAWLLLISTLANATFSGSFLVLISLTSPVLSSVAALLTIFLVAITDWLLPGGASISFAAIVGGLLIIGAFLLLSWSTYREMSEERKKHIEEETILSDEDD